MNNITVTKPWVKHFEHCVMPGTFITYGLITIFIGNHTIRRKRAKCESCGLVSVEPVGEITDEKG